MSVQLLAETEAPSALTSTAAPPIRAPNECAASDQSAYGRFNATSESRWIRAPGDPAGDRLFGSWRRSSIPLFPGEPMSDAARIAAAADGGFSTCVLTTKGLGHINSDFTAYLVREPRGEWLAVDGALRLAEGGIAVASAWLYDEDGPFGTVTAAGLAQDRVLEL